MLSFISSLSSARAGELEKEKLATTNIASVKTPKNRCFLFLHPLFIWIYDTIFAPPGQKNKSVPRADAKGTVVQQCQY
ncbi:MAG TPA: hypothetical protein DCX32_00030 [Candidatus Moranbacteria bacterium]|nr:hypothetical protein [Candidatus Moranbacteria bacterium]